MKTTDLFRFNRSAERINESIEKTFGQRLNLESFDLHKLEDARNKLRTQIHDARSQSGFNENIENEAMTKAQWMLDAINAEIAEREEFIADAGPAEVEEGAMSEIAAELGQVADEEDYDKLYDLLSDDGPVGKYLQGQIEEITGETGLHPKDDFEKIEQMLMDHIQQEFGGQNDDEGGETDDGYALASAGFGSDEDYESINNEGESKYTDVSIAQDVYAENPDLDSEDDILNAAFPHVVKMMGGNKKRANYLFNYDEDFPGEMISAYKWLQRQEHDVGEATGRDAYQRDYDASVSGMGRRERENDEGNTEPPNNFAVSINGKQWKVFKGRGQYADDMAERNHFRQLQDWARKKSESTGKKWSVHVTGENPAESIEEKAPPGAKAERMVKHIKKGYADDGKLTKKEKGIAYATAWKQHNKEKNESVNTGDTMTRLQEGEVQQASAIVTAKTMVDRVSRWIEELSGMENDTLLQLGDSIRDEMSQEQAKTFISSVAPAIQQALENLKTTRETLATGVRMLTGEEQGAEMLGGEPGADMAMGGDEMGPAEPDAMNTDSEELGGDEFAAAEPAAGMGDAGREQRESIDRSSNLLRVLAG